MGKGSRETGLAKYFEFGAHGTNYRRETVGGITTFLAMAYILAVNPDILSSTGMDRDALFTATALAAVVGTLVMAFLARYPIALAPGMGLNAFFAFTVVLGYGIAWEEALAGVFVSGIIFLILALSGVREAIINAIPQGLKYAVSAGIGFFIAFVGLQNSGIIVPSEATMVELGNLTHSGTLLTIFGIVVTAIFLTLKIRGGVFYGIIVTSIVGMIFGVVDLPAKIVSAPPSLTAFGAMFGPLLDPSVMLSSTMLIVIFTFLFVDFFDTAGTLVGVATQAGLMKDNKLPRAGKALASDSIATITGAVIGTSTTTAFVESSSGVAAGGRTGYASFITAICFFLALFFFPILTVVNSYVTAPALIIVGVLMASSLSHIKWGEVDEALPAFLTIIAMPLTYSIATGIALGFVLYPLTKVFKGEARKVHWIMYLLFVVFLLYFIYLV